MAIKYQKIILSKLTTWTFMVLMWLKYVCYSGDNVVMEAPKVAGNLWALLV